VLPDHDHPPASPEEYVNYSLHLEAKTFLHGLLLVEDKLSMAHSLETRVPFLDNDLVDFAQKLPIRLKLRDLEHVVRHRGLQEDPPARDEVGGDLHGAAVDATAGVVRVALGRP